MVFLRDFIYFLFSFFFFNHTATTEIYTLSLHDALPICRRALRRGAARGVRYGASRGRGDQRGAAGFDQHAEGRADRLDRKSTRLNSSHRCISYAVFCLKKKKKKNNNIN